MSYFSSLGLTVSYVEFPDLDNDISEEVFCLRCAYVSLGVEVFRRDKPQ